MYSKVKTRVPAAGVTLVEILIVLALFGVMAGTITLGFGATDRGKTMTQEADLLTARLNRAADEVILTATAMRFSWEDTAYAFAVQDAGQWVAHPIAILSQSHSLPDRLRLQSDMRQGAVVIGPDMIPDTGAALVLQIIADDQTFVSVRFDGINATTAEVGF